MAISVKLEAFEGPLDLLLHLIEKNKIDIYDIPIVEITAQYLDYIRQMQREDMNVMSEFLVMAATLIDIKCKMLLPKEVNEDGEEEDPRAELVQKLLEYKMYKYMSFELRDRQVDAARNMYREQRLPKEVEAYRQPIDYEELIGDMNLNKLHEIFRSIVKKQEDKIDPVRSQYGNIEKDEVDMDIKMLYVEAYAREHKTFSFRKLLEKQNSKMEVIVTFLIILELMKTGKINISQEEAVIEAILFTMGDSVEISRLAEVIEEDVKTTKSILKDMAARYEEENRGIGLTQFDDSVQLCTKADMYEYLIKIAKTPRKMTLTDTVLETLSIIAYKQPVTRLEIERVRGVSCDHAINKLLEYDLITELGRLDAPGRPLLFGTTEQFLRCFGVKSLEELPELNPVQVEEFKQQAEQEVQLTLNI